MATNETRLVHAIERAITAEYPDAWVLKVHGGPYQRAGVPDLLVCVYGYLIALEVKNQRAGESAEHAVDRATPAQRRELAAITKAGGAAQVVLSPQGALDTIKGMLLDNYS